MLQDLVTSCRFIVIGLICFDNILKLDKLIQSFLMSIEEENARGTLILLGKYPSPAVMQAQVPN